MISQLHLPCPLFYETTYIKFLLAREKKGISEGRKEGSKANKQGMDFQDDAWKGFLSFLGKKKKKTLKKKHIYYLLGYKVNPRLSFFFIIPSFIHSLAANKIM